MKQFSFKELREHLESKLGELGVIGLDALTEEAIKVAPGLGLNEPQVRAYIASFGNEILGSYTPEAGQPISEARSGELGGPRKAFTPVQTFMGNRALGD